MHAEAVFPAQFEDLGKRIDGSDGGAAQRGYDRPHIALAQFVFKRGQIHAAAMVGADRGEREPQNAGDTAVRVMRLVGSDDPFWGACSVSAVPRYPQRFKVGDGAARGEVAQVLVIPAEHGGDFADRFDLHLGAGAAAVAGMVVGVDEHGESDAARATGCGGLSIWPA